MNKPKYSYGDKVKFKIKQDGKELIKEGEVYIIDKNGTFFNPGKPSYDIMVHNDEHKCLVGYPNGERKEEIIINDCLYKHIGESLIINEE